MTPEGDTLARLRSATRAQHARLDGLFPHGIRDDADYRRYLRGMQSVMAAMSRADPMLARVYARSLRHLDEDMRILDCAAAIALTPDIAGRHRYWGHRYVIDGSSMGARVLVRDVAALGWTAEQGAAFLAYHLRRGRSVSPRLRAQLARLDARGADPVVASADATFAFVADAFRAADTMDH